MACPPASAIMAAVSSIVSGRLYGEGRPFTLRPVQYTIAPASPSARATPRPAPRVAPATRATRPANGREERGFFDAVRCWLIIHRTRGTMVDIMRGDFTKALFAPSEGHTQPEVDRPRRLEGSWRAEGGRCHDGLFDLIRLVEQVEHVPD